MFSKNNTRFATLGTLLVVTAAVPGTSAASAASAPCGSSKESAYPSIVFI